MLVLIWKIDVHMFINYLLSKGETSHSKNIIRFVTYAVLIASGKEQLASVGSVHKWRWGRFILNPVRTVLITNGQTISILL